MGVCEKDGAPTAINPKAAVHAGAATDAKPLPKWPILALLAVAVIVPALFWRQVWFGGALSDKELRRRLTHPERSRDVMHACEQISRRMQRDPKDAVQFYDLLAALADHRDPRVRNVVAWCMGEDDTRYPPFHRSLHRLVTDEAPQVRYNAAAALVRFGDPAGRPVLREMLVPYAVPAQWAGASTEGTVIDVLAEDDPVRPLTRLALVDTGEDESEPVLAPLGGRVAKVMVGSGDRIRKGDPVCTVEPDATQVWTALRALALVGRAEDLKNVERYLDPKASFFRDEAIHIRSQAELAAAAIRRREERRKRTK